MKTLQSLEKINIFIHIFEYCKYYQKLQISKIPAKIFKSEKCTMPQQQSKKLWNVSKI